MLSLKTAFDAIVWSDCQELITYKEVFEAMTGQYPADYAKKRHLKKIAYFVDILTDNK